jgi:hypothetical protein
MRDALKNAHPLVQLSALVLIGFVSMFILLGFVMVAFVISGSSIGFLSNPGSISDPNEPAVFALKVMQIMQAIGLFVIPYILYRSLHKSDNPCVDNAFCLAVDKLFSRMEQQSILARITARN